MIRQAGYARDCSDEVDRLAPCEWYYSTNKTMPYSLARFRAVLNYFDRLSSFRPWGSSTLCRPPRLGMWSWSTEWWCQPWHAREWTPSLKPHAISMCCITHNVPPMADLLSPKVCREAALYMLSFLALLCTWWRLISNPRARSTRVIVSFQHVWDDSRGRSRYVLDDACEIRGESILL